jgi:4-amino-4-deoxy-L-arabinose transferase-like glycosyltransferase
MWHSGAAGAIVGGTCFVYSAVRIYTLVDELTGSRIGAWCAFGVYMANLNLLYLQSTALTEPVLLAFLVGATFHLARWMRTRSVRSLAIAGVLTFCATLSRFDGWAFLLAAATIVMVWTWVGRRQPKEV